MSFFIRKDTKSDMDKKFSGRKKPGNTEMKRRPQKRDRTPKHLLGKRKQQPHKRPDSVPQKFNLNKKPRIDPNEEIESSSDDDGDDEVGKRKVTEQQQKFASKEDLETPQEKKLRLAKLYLEEIEKEELERKENEDVDAHLLVSNRLREDVLKEEGRLRKEVAEKIAPDLKNKIGRAHV